MNENSGDAVVAAPATAAGAASPEALRPDAGHRRVHDWQVRVSIFSSDDESEAHVVLVSDAPTHLTASGHSRRSRGDYPTPEIGDEIAVARALHRLADRLLDTAVGDIEQLTEEHDVTLRPL